VVVLDDGWLALIKVKQQRRNLALYGTGLGAETDAPPAHYFGVPAVAANDPESLAAALRQALAASGPTVIEAKVDSSHYSETVYD
jgi:thiamine pyrophosphate-dependent acetolactate synthase large subunit-like protein